MSRLLYFGTLVLAFGGASWAGYEFASVPADEAGAASSAPAASPQSPRVPAPAAAPTAAPSLSVPALGDTDAGGPARKPKPDDGVPLRVTFNDLSQWDLDPKDVQVPASILAMGGRMLDIVGYMIPCGNPDSVEEFALVRDLGSCCFGLTPLPHHIVECRFEPGKSCAFLPGPIRVRGRFRVEEHRQGQYLLSVYAITVRDCAEVR